MKSSFNLQISKKMRISRRKKRDEWMRNWNYFQINFTHWIALTTRWHIAFNSSGIVRIKLFSSPQRWKGVLVKQQVKPLPFILAAACWLNRDCGILISRIKRKCSSTTEAIFSLKNIETFIRTLSMPHFLRSLNAITRLPFMMSYGWVVTYQTTSNYEKDHWS